MKQALVEDRLELTEVEPTNKYLRLVRSLKYFNMHINVSWSFSWPLNSPEVYALFSGNEEIVTYRFERSRKHRCVYVLGHFDSTFAPEYLAE